jgi:hypothetical protein
MEDFMRVEIQDIVNLAAEVFGTQPEMIESVCTGAYIGAFAIAFGMFIVKHYNLIK